MRLLGIEWIGGRNREPQVILSAPARVSGQVEDPHHPGKEPSIGSLKILRLTPQDDRSRVLVRERLPRGAARSARAVEQWSDLAAVPEIQNEPRQE
jgi:hypothetical protein